MVSGNFILILVITEHKNKRISMIYFASVYTFFDVINCCWFHLSLRLCYLLVLLSHRSLISQWQMTHTIYVRETCKFTKRAKKIYRPIFFFFFGWETRQFIKRCVRNSEWKRGKKNNWNNFLTFPITIGCANFNSKIIN